MVSLTRRIDEIYQPIGGYLNKDLFNVNEFGGKYINLEDENIVPNVMGMIIDYLAKLYYAETKQEKERILKMSHFALIKCQSEKLAEIIIDNQNKIIFGEYLSDEYIKAVCKIAPFDAVYRAGLKPSEIKIVEPDEKTVEHIRILTDRTINYLGKNKFNIVAGFNFKFKNIKPTKVHSADGDFIKNKTIVDLKVSKDFNITPKQSLQIYCYYLMGKMTSQQQFKYINSIAKFNPRYNVEHYLDVIKINSNIKYYVNYNVLGVDLNEK